VIPIRFALSLLAAALLPCAHVAPAAGAAPAADVALAVTVEVDFGEDVGQNFGTLFEVTDAAGRTLAGAGFPGLYNTTCRNDRRGVQCFVRPAGGDGAPVLDTLPRFSADTGVAIGDVDGRLYATGHQVDQRVHLWDPEAGTWAVPAELATGRLRHGDGRMHLGPGVLSFHDNRVTYDGPTVLEAPAGESIHHVYYALGHLFFFHDRPGPAEQGGFTRVFALRWKPGAASPDLARAVAFPTATLHETTWGWGQVKDTVITVTNWGTVLVFDGTAWRTLREHDGRSYQVYAMLNHHDRLLLGQYPDGSLHEFDGATLTMRQRWPPAMPGVATSSREAQSLALYRGDLYVGVWPWAEVWRLDGPRSEWSLVRRLFTRPPPTAAVGHPFEAELAAHNAARGTSHVINDWGQRVTSLAVVGDALYLGTSNKGGLPRPADFTFIDDPALAEYGLVHRLRLPGYLWAQVRWVDGPTRFQLVVTGDRMRFLQDGRELASGPLDPAAAALLRGGRVVWGEGVFGPLAGTLVARSTE